MSNCNCNCCDGFRHSRRENVEHAIYGGVFAFIGFVACAFFAYSTWTSPLVSGFSDWAGITITLLIGIAGTWYCQASIREAKICRKGT